MCVSRERERERESVCVCQERERDTHTDKKKITKNFKLTINYFERERESVRWGKKDR